ncbi:hypothetical protein, variant [Aphanomyces invadans]|uniref:G-protein coupled receptors family 1 profile domain-containing protein n=1 Tax=Aphanomyces invadans TaxID=157072 RepID=A0A024TN34_9STRA|nr:hypothetical protein, variant [Aphanomyces invadans]ETV95575.1 hypothetical protein, variant [Aphanomyces invadans]|eukprot:XP_008875768.1 hypothetical protein, variant [Aphanomyces invadans]
MSTKWSRPPNMTSSPDGKWSRKADIGEDEWLGITWAIRVTSVLSAIGCVFILYRFAVRPRTERDVTTVLVTALAAFELIIAIAKFPALSFIEFKRGRDALGYFLDSSGPMCQIQAYLLDVFMLQAVLWYGCIAFNLLRVVVYRDSEKKLMSRFWKIFFSTSLFTVLWGLSAALPIWPDKHQRLDTLFGYSKFFCWIQETRYIVIRFIPFLVATLLFIAAVMIKVRRVILARAKRARPGAAISDDAVNQIQRRLMLYVLSFLVLYTPIAAFRIIAAVQSSGTNDARNRNKIAEGIMPEFGIVAQAMVNLQGFVNAIIYGGFLTFAPTTQRRQSMSSSLPPSVYLEDARSHASGYGVGGNGGDSISIFASTFNMAEGAVPPNDQLSQWIPKGKDVYVIGVQECLDLRSMRKAMAAHIQRINGKPFIEYGREIGRTEKVLGFHGFIAITVYVASADVHAGHFYMHLEGSSKVNRGVNLIGLGRASNKGAVGFAFRYHNLTFAVLTCHLASDSTGKSKIKKRHQDGSNILTNMHLQSIDNEFDCHLMAHHTIFMGDLNYRLTALDATPDHILNLIASVVNNVQSNAFSRGDAFSSHAVLSSGSPAPIAGDFDDAYILTQSPSALEAAPNLQRLHQANHVVAMSPHSSSTSSIPNVNEVSWRSLMEHDELKLSMDDGQIFHDFDEAMIAFPPTYRRVVGQHLDVRAPLSPAHLANNLYTTDLGEGKIRVPSYTDRILFHSLPGLRVRRSLSVMGD